MQRDGPDGRLCVYGAALDDGALAGRTRRTTMAGQQVPNQRVDAAVAFAAQLGIFVDGQILSAANLLRLEQSSRSLTPELVQFLALRILWHVGSF